jgi:heme-degrading monooxygenase HmoA
LVRPVRRQLAEARGLVGYSLFGKPFAKQYWTLSVWENEAALQAFVRESPHQEVMSALAADMGKTQFARWQMHGSEGQPSWDDALRRLGPDGAP